MAAAGVERDGDRAHWGRWEDAARGVSCSRDAAGAQRDRRAVKPMLFRVGLAIGLRWRPTRSDGRAAPEPTRSGGGDLVKRPRSGRVFSLGLLLASGDRDVVVVFAAAKRPPRSLLCLSVLLLPSRRRALTVSPYVTSREVSGTEGRRAVDVLAGAATLLYAGDLSRSERAIGVRRRWRWSVARGTSWAGGRGVLPTIRGGHGPPGRWYL